MKQQELNKLRKVLKPLVMECIREAIFEEGVLSTLVAEIATGMNQQPIVENKQIKPERDLTPEYATALSQLVATIKVTASCNI